jgi:progressive ankylosis protein
MRQRDIFWFWLPLFASWLLMTAEGPIISAAINRLPNEVIMLAAYGIVVSLSVTIESPIINMLATSTALVKDRPSFLLVRRFTIHWAIGLTVVAALVAFTPLFEVVVMDWLEAPPVVAAWVRPGMQIMTFWTAAIAWRRFLQG